MGSGLKGLQLVSSFLCASFRCFLSFFRLRLACALVSLCVSVWVPKEISAWSSIAAEGAAEEEGLRAAVAPRPGSDSVST